LTSVNVCNRLKTKNNISIGTLLFEKKQKKQKTKRHERFQEIKLEKAGTIAEGDQTQARYKKLVETV
jgi:hypothetical protein